MNDNFESQKEQLISIKHEISLLHQQINYLLRNEKALGLLDLDVLMNRTHTIYDQLCSINLGETATEDDFDLDPEAVAGLFGGMVPEAENEEVEEETEPEAEEITELEEKPVAEVQEENPMETEIQEETVAEPTEQQEEIEEVENQEIEIDGAEEAAKEEEMPVSDEIGFFFRFEDVPTPEEETAPVIDQTVEKDGKLVHIMEEVPEEEIPERDRVSGEELVVDNPLEMPQMEDETPVTEEIVPETPAPEDLSSIFGNDDTEFELSTPETLGERMMHEDNSLAARLQQNPLQDLRLAIGVNDKFLFVNELFGGSMEKYNKSIENLNDLKTLNGAMIYLNELKIELQWNSSNEAYQKLVELVRRKFERV